MLRSHVPIQVKNFVFSNPEPKICSCYIKLKNVVFNLFYQAEETNGIVKFVFSFL